MPEIQTTPTERMLVQALRGLDRLRADAAQRMHEEAAQLEARSKTLTAEAERLVAAHRREWLAALAGIAEAHELEPPAPGVEVLASPDAGTLEWPGDELDPESAEDAVKRLLGPAPAQSPVALVPDSAITQSDPAQ